MTTFRRIAIGCLVGLLFAAGFGARLNCAAHERAIARSFPTAMPGTRVASADVAAGNVDMRPLEIMLTVLKSLREHYVDQITPQQEGKMTHDSLRAMMALLDDPNSRFVDAEQRKIIADANEGTYHGIGAILGVKKVKTGNITEEHLVVVTPIEAGPAAKAGIKPGDDIRAIDGKAVLPLDPFQRANEIVKEDRGKKISDIRKHLSAEEKRIKSGMPIVEAENTLVTQDDKEFELTIARKGSSKEIKVKVQPGRFQVDPVNVKLLAGDNLGYVKINALTASTGKAFQDAIRQVKSGGAKGLIIDLRSVAGGGLEFAREVAGPVIGGRTLAIERRSRGRRLPLKVADHPVDDSWNGPIAVLVNGGTARMSEVLAAAFRDGASAKLVGEKTHGDLSEATVLDQKDGSAVIMTIGEFLSPKGIAYNGKGIPVDVQVASSAADAQLEKAIKLLSSAGDKG